MAPTDVVQGIDDWEMHVSLEAPGPKRSTNINWRNPASPPESGAAGTNIIVFQEEHVNEFRFQNLAPGGVAELTFRSASKAPEGQTSLKFTVLTPGEQEIANLTLSPSATSTPPAKRLNLELRQFGEFVVRVEGRAVLADYQITGRIVPPKRLDFTMWWENVTFERKAVEEVSGCKERILNSLTSGVVSGIDREDPPQMNVKVLVVASAVSVVGVLFLVKLVSDAVIAGQFKSVFGGKK
ncbi:MAG: hypothetical protein HYT80_08155 [Euryarchaeota archaeon]|nr:hypothetical protein [Euryarchaeota archaeon]